jgi:beta-N-acetylhexosaminidase
MRAVLRGGVAFFLGLSLAFAPAKASTAQPYTHLRSPLPENAQAAFADGRDGKLPTYKPYTRRASREALKWADAELRRMTLEEKVGQLVSVGINATFLSQESEAFKQLRRHVEQNHVGGIILFRGSVYESVHLVNRMQQLARRPLLISADLEAGAGMRFIDTINFPWNMAVGATGNAERARSASSMFSRPSST